MPLLKYIKTIALVYNLKRIEHAGDEEEEFDEQETIDALCSQIRRMGVSAIALEYTPRLTDALIRHRPDFVFNIAEGFGRSRSRESQVPCILEALHIPYSGSDPLSLGVTLDKYLTNTILAAAGIPVPKMILIKSREEIPLVKDACGKGKQFIVKPRWEGSSKGITNDAFVDSYARLRRQVSMILEKYCQPALIEEFLPGDEITVGMYGNERPRALGMMRIVPRQKTREPFIYSLENKREWKTKVLYEAERCVPLRLRRDVLRCALQAFAALELRDVARIDFRSDLSGLPKIIDINPLPGLSPAYSDLPIMCRLNGISYARLIKLILISALKRYGFSLPKKRLMTHDVRHTTISEVECQ